MNPQLLQLIVVLAPIVGSAILTPLLVAIIGRAKSRAEAGSIEATADKTRIDAVDVLFGHMREEIKTLKSDLAGERAVSRECRTQLADCEDEREADQRACADSLRWGIALYDQINQLGHTPVKPPVRVVGLVEDLDVDSTRVLPSRKSKTQEIEGGSQS